MGACGLVSEARGAPAWAEYVACVGAMSSIRRAVCLGPWGHAVSGQQMGLWLLFPRLCLTWPLPPALREQLVHSLHCNAPRTAIFLLVLYFAHNINLYRDPAPGFIHLCLTSGDISHWGFCFFSSSSFSAESKLFFFFFVTLSIVPILSNRQRYHLSNPVQKSASASRILVKGLKGGTFEKSRPFKSRSDVCCHCCIVVVNI